MRRNRPTAANRPRAGNSAELSIGKITCGEFELAPFGVAVFERGPR